MNNHSKSKIQKSSIMVTSSIKFWKAMEKFDVSRSLFLSKKLESRRFKSSMFSIYIIQFTVDGIKSFKIQHSK
ncbi:MAG: hypothetical protein CMP13_09370 [Zunongwangia sp.]|nr:hypothetical protein [Zunongwangia sp.]